MANTLREKSRKQSYLGFQNVFWNKSNQGSERHVQWKPLRLWRQKLKNIESGPFSWISRIGCENGVLSYVEMQCLWQWEEGLSQTCRSGLEQLFHLCVLVSSTWEAEMLMFIFPSPDYSGFNIPGSSGVLSMLGYFCKVSYLKASVLAVPSLWNVLSFFFLLENFFFHTVFSLHSFLLYQVLPDPLCLSTLSTLNLSFSLFKKQTKEETHIKNFSQNRNQI